MLFILDHLVTPRGQTRPLHFVQLWFMVPPSVHGVPPGGTLPPDQVTEPQV